MKKMKDTTRYVNFIVMVVNRGQITNKTKDLSDVVSTWM